MSLVDDYNNISRSRLKLPFFITNVDKDAIGRKLTVSLQDSLEAKQAKLQLCAALFMFKYYRQSQTEDITKQEEYLAKVSDIVQNNPDLGVSTEECMLYVKNDGFLVQKKITDRFKSLLREISSEDNATLHNYIKKFTKDDGESLFDRVKQFFLDNIGFALTVNKKVVKETNMPITDKVLKFEASIKNCEVKLNDERWSNYMSREKANVSIAWTCIQNNISPQEAVNALNKLDFADFFKGIEGGKKVSYYGFSTKFIEDKGYTNSFKAPDNRRNIRDSLKKEFTKIFCDTVDSQRKENVQTFNLSKKI